MESKGFPVFSAGQNLYEQEARNHGSSLNSRAKIERWREESPYKLRRPTSSEVRRSSKPG
jgi:hypothetical protein